MRKENSGKYNKTKTPQRGKPPVCGVFYNSKDCPALRLSSPPRRPSLSSFEEFIKNRRELKTCGGKLSSRFPLAVYGDYRQRTRPNKDALTFNRFSKNRTLKTVVLTQSLPLHKELDAAQAVSEGLQSYCLTVLRIPVTKSATAFSGFTSVPILP